MQMKVPSTSQGTNSRTQLAMMEEYFTQREASLASPGTRSSTTLLAMMEECFMQRLAPSASQGTHSSTTLLAMMEEHSMYSVASLTSQKTNFTRVMQPPAVLYICVQVM